MPVTRYPADTPATDLPWSPYTPTVSTISNPQPSGWTQIGFYRQEGKLVTARFTVSAPATNLGTGRYLIALPTPAAASYPPSGTIIGNVYFEDLGTTGFIGFATIYAGSSTMTVGYMGAGSTLYNAIAPTLPFTWGLGDFITGEILYEAA